MLMPNTLGEEVNKEHMERLKADIQMKSMFDKEANDSAKPSKIQQTFLKFESKYVQPIFGSKAPPKNGSPKNGSLNDLSWSENLNRDVQRYILAVTSIEKYGIDCFELCRWYW